MTGFRYRSQLNNIELAILSRKKKLSNDLKGLFVSNLEVEVIA